MIFARTPRLGRVKTRLAADIGETPALRFYRATLNAVSRRLAADPRWTTWLGVTPDAAVRDIRAIPCGIPRIPQGGGDLGDRMTRCMKRFGTHPVAIVGSDVPGLERRHVAEAFEALRRCEFVFGPSDDGGYWLVGAAHGARVGTLFGNVRWSGAHALSDTVANAAPAARVAFLQPLADIDDGDAFRAWQSGS